MRDRNFWPFAALGLGALSFAVGLGACTGGSGAAPQVTPPPHVTTPSPKPTLVLSPRSLTFPPGNPAPKQVAITAPDPNNNDIAIVKDSCTPQHIVTAIQPSPPPPSPSPSPLSSVYNVTPGKTNGSCKVTFEDLISMALGALHITNLSGAPVRSP